MPRVRKLLLATLTGCALALLAFVGTAAADGGPHGGYTATTDSCAGCHRTHTAQAPKLLTAPIGQLCLTCHAGTGATTNVMAGVLLDAPGGSVLGSLKAGGFTSAVMSTDFGTAASRGVTSTHTHDGTLGTMWGNGSLTGSPNPGLANFALTCTSCHDPHGNGQYRILRPIPTGSLATTPVAIADVVTKNYAINPSGDALGRVAGQYFGQGYGTGCSTNLTTQNPSNKTVCEFGDPASNARSTSGRLDASYTAMSAWCSSCHTRYSAPSAAGAASSGDALFAYRHLSNGAAGGCTRCHAASPYTSDNLIAPLGTPFDNGQFRHDVQCMTCHVSHGTAAQMTPNPTGFAGMALAYPDGSTVTAHNDRSSLLRLDGRGTCQGCHNK